MLLLRHKRLHLRGHFFSILDDEKAYKPTERPRKCSVFCLGMHHLGVAKQNHWSRYKRREDHVVLHQIVDFQPQILRREQGFSQASRRPTLRRVYLKSKGKSLIWQGLPSLEKRWAHARSLAQDNLRDIFQVHPYQNKVQNFLHCFPKANDNLWTFLQDMFDLLQTFSSARYT